MRFRGRPVRSDVSDPHSASNPDTDGDAGDERSSGEELLESEERVMEADRRDRERREGDPTAEPTAEEEAADDAEDVESEWHVWILGLLAVAGIALFFAPRSFVPELLGTLGLFLVAIGVLGYAIEWAIERSAGD